MPSIIRATTTSGLQVAPDNSGSLVLQTNGTTTALTIDTSQNVGIGTTSPNNTLQIGNGTATKVYTRIAGTISDLYIGQDTGSTIIGSTSAARVIQGSSSPLVIGTASAQPLVFGTGDTERMRIGSDGFVRVNNTGGLDGQFSSLTGSWYAGAFANTDATITTVYSWNKATSGNNLFYQFYTDTGALRGSIDYNRAGNAVRYNTTSDQRLKENIVDAPSAIDLINSVKIRSFDWKETGFHVDYGVIAQELNEVAPDAVSEGIDNEDGTIKQSWGVDTSVLIPALIKTVQEQQTIINDLKARVETLETK